jgi:Tfp pilus assembly protein PilX
MRRRAEHAPRTCGHRLHRGNQLHQRSRGYLLPVVLGLILVAAMLAVHAISGAADAAALVTNHVLQQRALEAAERGLATALHQLEAGRPLPTTTLQLTSTTTPEEWAEIEFRETARLALPTGYSSGLFIEQRGQVRSIGHLRSTSARLVAGFSRILPQTAPPLPP